MSSLLSCIVLDFRDCNTEQTPYCRELSEEKARPKKHTKKSSEESLSLTVGVLRKTCGREIQGHKKHHHDYSVCKGTRCLPKMPLNEAQRQNTQLACATL